MYKTSVHALVNGGLAHRKQQKLQKVILPAIPHCIDYMFYRCKDLTDISEL